ncbi:Putative CoA-binding protein [Halorhabdus sp. SVX81]|nr:Putative CoA-binding protein [Halorhabdus sp. SVX81]WEL21491.1 Putative CoA-binding protein [Halorhabdus sp. BNX81]
MAEILETSETIAVVGCSSTPGKAAHDIPKYLLEAGYDVIPVNPFAETIFGRDAYDSLLAVPDEVDVVNVFRPGEEVPDIVESALDREDDAVIWLQEGITHDESARKAEAAGRQFVQDRCMKVEHQRLLG